MSTPSQPPGSPGDDESRPSAPEPGERQPDGAGSGEVDSRRAELGSVSETLMWNLYHRAHEARHPRTVLPDPVAVDLVERVDYPFAEVFGAPNSLLAQGQALRVRTFDEAVRRFLDVHPEGTVVALAEGLETQFWRVDNGRMRWLTVELPETARLRTRLLPDDERRRTLARSVLDHTWCDEVDPDRGVLVTAQGLLMYLQPPQVRELLATVAERFPGGDLVFDAVPRWFAERTRRGAMQSASGYSAPPMHWALDAGDLPRLRTAHPALREPHELPLPRGRGFYYGALSPLLAHLPAVRNIRPTMTVGVRVE